LVLLAIALMLAKGADERRRKAVGRALNGLPATPIGAVRDGHWVRIRGRAVAHEPLVTSPVSQRLCIGYRLTVDCRDGAIYDWQPVVEEDGFQPFVIGDDTGEAVVHPPFDILLQPYRESSLEATSPMLARLLAKKGLPASEVFGMTRSFRYVETILMPGDSVIAAGRAAIEIDQAGRAPSPRDMPVMCHLKGGDKPVLLAAPE
jgi:hypothetical protein